MRHKRRCGRGRRRQRGGNFWGSLKKFGNKANNFLKKSHLISKVGRAGDFVGVPYVGTIGKMAGSVGYGRKRRTVRTRRRRKGGSLGGALRLAGGRRRLGMQY